MLSGIYNSILTVVYKQPNIMLMDLVEALRKEYPGFSEGHLTNSIFKLHAYGYVVSVVNRVNNKVIARYSITDYGKKTLNTEILNNNQQQQPEML